MKNRNYAYTACHQTKFSCSKSQLVNRVLEQKLFELFKTQTDLKLLN